MKIKLPKVRTDLEDFFKHLRGRKNLPHHPFIVFDESPKTYVKIDIVHKPKELLENYKDKQKVLCQWGGQWRSDFFKFTVGEFRRFLKNNPN